MKNQIVITWKALMDNRFNPLKYMDLASRHYFMQLLAWMWSMIFSVSFLSIYYCGYVWLSHLLIVAGVFITISVFTHAEKRRKTLAPAPYLSRASKCIWQMDREA